MPRKHKLTHKQASSMLWGLFIAALVAEGGLAWHAWSLHDVVGSGLVVTAWCRESIITLVEHLAVETVETV